MWDILGIGIGVVCVILAWWYKKRVAYFRLFEERGISGPTPHLLFGSADDFLTNSFSALDKWYKQYGDSGTYGFFYGTQPFLVTTDLNFIQRVLVKEFTKFNSRSELILVDSVHPIASNALLTVKPERWKQLRSYISTVFTPAKIKTMGVASMTMGCKDLLHALSQRVDTEFDIGPVWSCLLVDNVSRFTFGLESHSLLNDAQTPPLVTRLLNALKTVGNTWFNKYGMSFTFLIPPIRFGFHSKLITHPLDVVVNDIVQMVDARRDSKVERNDFIDALLRAEAYCDNQNFNSLKADMDTTNTNASDDVKKTNQPRTRIPPMDSYSVTANATLFFGVGIETTSSTLGFMSYFLSKNQDVQDRLRDEIVDAVNGNGGKITYELAMNLEYMGHVIDETLRIEPPVKFFTTRQSLEEFDYNGKIFPKGTNVGISTYQLHHNPKYFPDPERFDPDRFSKDRRSEIPLMAFQPFGDGPRNCIGMRMAYIQIRFTLCHVLLNYKLLPGSVEPVRKDGGIVFSQYDSINVRLERV